MRSFLLTFLLTIHLVLSISLISAFSITELEITPNNPAKGIIIINIVTDTPTNATINLNESHEQKKNNTLNKPHIYI